jgi:hypothetical protein
MGLSCRGIFLFLVLVWIYLSPKKQEVWLLVYHRSLLKGPNLAWEYFPPKK